eukprot:2078612-Rhodomonas_salina.2
MGVEQYWDAERYQGCWRGRAWVRPPACSGTTCPPMLCSYAMILRSSYAMFGTDLEYAPTPPLRDVRY